MYKNVFSILEFASFSRIWGSSLGSFFMYFFVLAGSRLGFIWLQKGQGWPKNDNWRFDWFCCMPFLKFTFLGAASLSNIQPTTLPDYHFFLITCSQVAHSVHQCVYRCAMHWRRVTANRVRQRGGKPRPRRVIEPKPDWPIATLSETTRPVPSVPPSTYSMEVHRCGINIVLQIFH